jgi:phenylpropionate dioxygenase-like ring-hydroxylating dioxygenase large terminal subunit
MDPAHVTYAHYGIIRTRPPKGILRHRVPLILFVHVVHMIQNKTFPAVKADREGGCPVELSVKKLGIDGFLGDQDQYGTNKFIAPCVSYAYSSPVVDKGEGIVSSDGTEKVSIYMIRDTT